MMLALRRILVSQAVTEQVPSGLHACGNCFFSISPKTSKHPDIHARRTLLLVQHCPPIAKAPLGAGIQLLEERHAGVRCRPCCRWLPLDAVT